MRTFIDLCTKVFNHRGMNLAEGDLVAGCREQNFPRLKKLGGKRDAEFDALGRVWRSGNSKYRGQRRMPQKCGTFKSGSLPDSVVPETPMSQATPSDRSRSSSKANHPVCHACIRVKCNARFAGEWRHCPLRLPMPSMVYVSIDLGLPAGPLVRWLAGWSWGSSKPVSVVSAESYGSHYI
jgi:hypothetical protein